MARMEEKEEPIPRRVKKATLAKMIADRLKRKDCEDRYFVSLACLLMDLRGWHHEERTGKTHVGPKRKKLRINKETGGVWSNEQGKEDITEIHGLVKRLEEQRKGPN